MAPFPTEVDPRLAAALNAQLEDWRSALAKGARRVGWKLGTGERESIGGDVVTGHLTSTTCLPSGSIYRAGGDRALHADAEVAVVLSAPVEGDEPAAVRDSIGGYAAALELVDLAGTDDPERIVAENIFHRAVSFGPVQGALPSDLEGRLLVGGETRAAGAARGDYVSLVAAVARQLRAVGERLEAGDRIITGSFVQVRIGVGDHVVADLGPLGRAELSVAS
jgi:2-keto-4-pentenoate hydratase